MTDANYLVKKESLQSLADTIRNKTGTNSQLLFPNDFKNAITNIDTNKWVRPRSWPNLDSIDMSEFDGAYLTYDLNFVDYPSFASVYYSIDTDGMIVTLELGHLESGIFISDKVLASSNSNKGDLAVELLPENGDVQLLRLSTSSGHFVAFNLQEYNDMTYVIQPLGELKARFPSLTTTSAGNRGIASQYTESVQVDFGTNHSLAYAFTIAHNLQQLKITGTGKISDAAYMLYNSHVPSDFSFTELDFSECTSARAMVGGPAYYDVIDLRGTGLGETQLSSTISYLFYNNPMIKKLYMTGIDLGQNVIYNGSWLQEFLPGVLYPTDINLNNTLLNHVSVLAIVNALPTLESTTATIKLGAGSETLTSDEIAIATNKGWTVA